MSSALALLAVDPTGLGGMVLRGEGREAALAWLRAALAPVRHVPLHVSEDRLHGGIDLAGTLRQGRAVAAPGLLAEAAGGVLVLSSAERVAPGTAGAVAAVLDRGAASVVALDESMGPDEQVPTLLQDRLAFWGEPPPELPDRETVQDARHRLPQVAVPDALIEELCATAAALGIVSLRAPLLAVRAARAAAALAGRMTAEREDAEIAARLVLAPRARTLPADAESADAESAEAPDAEPEPPEPEGEPQGDGEDGTASGADIVLAAAVAAIPPGLLASLQAGTAGKAGAAGQPGRAGAGRRGRPAGTRAGDPRRSGRLNVFATLVAAAPWQRLRAPQRTSQGASRLQIRTSDLRVTHYKPRSATVTIFAVDASGSQALHRLAEAKGAVEMLLAECYVRRDEVALLAFRGREANVLLPPTTSLVRAKRALAGLPGGGGTPLAQGIDAALVMADAVQRRGLAPSIVFLTDGRANIGRDGAPGRPAAMRDAHDAARRLRQARYRALLVDTSMRPDAAGRDLAAAMGARYLALPLPQAEALSRSVQAALSYQGS